MPKIAPLMPAARPEEAPPREVAGKADTDKGGNSEADEAKPSEDVKPPPNASKRATKKRR
jgi:hypothetical protein